VGILHVFPELLKVFLLLCKLLLELQELLLLAHANSESSLAFSRLVNASLLTEKELAALVFHIGLDHCVPGSPPS
jgi:hypothetical protein